MREESTMWYNPIMAFLLRSPLHGIVSANLMLLTYTGRRSGRTYTLPVSYYQGGSVLTTTSFRDRTWWRNLRGGAPVTLRLRGRDVKGTSQVIEDDEEVAEALDALFRRAPQIARYYGVSLDPDGRPDVEDIAVAAEEKVVIRTTLE
jgi:deazaflavin-dependent oxidoreductase (nitroreductase family)